MRDFNSVFVFVLTGEPRRHHAAFNHLLNHRRMTDDMDINCGTIVDGEETIQQNGQRIFDLILRVASGEPTKSEQFDFGAAEFAPWQLGATM